jgi:hypothetical protein
VSITLLRGGCGKITRQLGNIENNTRFFLDKNYVLKCNFWLCEVGCVIFGMKHKKGQKKSRDRDFQGWNNVAV